MFIGFLLGLAAFAELLHVSHTGELAAFFLEGGSPWTAVALFGIFLFVLAQAAPTMTRTLGATVAMAFLWVSVDPNAPQGRVAEMFFPLLCLAAISLVAALVARRTPMRPRTRPQDRYRSSRQVRAMLRAYAATRA